MVHLLHRLYGVDAPVCAKSYKIKKVGLKPLGKKNSQQLQAAAANFFSKRYKGHRRCPLLAAATVGLCQLIMGLRSWSFAQQCC